MKENTILTFCFYLFYMISVMFSYKLNHKNINWYFVISLTFLLGLRGCGIDTKLYIETFHFYRNIDAGIFDPRYYDPYFDKMREFDLHTEWFYLVLVKFIKIFSKSSVWYFLIIDFLSALALDRFVNRFKSTEKAWILFFFFTTLVFVQMFNIMRQFLAFMIFLNLVDFIKDREWKQYFVGVIILYLFFHKSAIMLIPFYFFVHRDLLKNRVLQLVVYFSVLAFSVIFIEQLKMLMDALFLFFGGGNVINADYLNSEEQILELKNSLLTIFFYSSTMVYMIIHSKKFKETYGLLGVIVYNFAYIGMIVVNLSFNRGVERINVYFYSFLFIVLGLMIYQSLRGYFKSKPIMTLYSYGLIILYIAWFSNSVLQGAADCSPYVLNPEL